MSIGGGVCGRMSPTNHCPTTTNGSTNMTKKTVSKTKPASVKQTVKFAKGGFYQDLGGDLWFCTNAKQKKVGNDTVVMMQPTENGQPVPVKITPAFLSL